MGGRAGKCRKPRAYQESIKAGEGISGSVFIAGKSLLIKDIQKSSFSPITKRAKDPRKSMISSPILVNCEIIDVININGPKFKCPFNLDDLNLQDIVALFVGKSIQVIQLQSVLNSRFAQIASAHETEKTIENVLVTAAQNPDKMAKMWRNHSISKWQKRGLVLSTPRRSARLPAPRRGRTHESAIQAVFRAQPLGGIALYWHCASEQLGRCAPATPWFRNG